MEFVDLNLARRLEMAEAHACRACAEAFHQQHPEFPVAVEEIAGGFAVFAGVDSPVTQAIGVGLHGEVSDFDLDRLQDFFISRATAAAVELCPLVHMSLYERFAKRGFHLLEVSDVLFRKLTPMDSDAQAVPSNIVVRRAAPDEAQLWTKTVAAGFAEYNLVTQLDSRRDGGLLSGGSIVSSRLWMAQWQEAPRFPREEESAVFSVRARFRNFAVAAHKQRCCRLASNGLPHRDATLL